MNRKQRRRFVGSAKKKGIPKNIAEMYLRLKEIESVEEDLNDGDKVKLDIEKIQGHPDYEALTPAYKEFVERHAGAVLTVSHKNTGGLKGVVTLEEDPKWLFWTGNLIKIEE